MNIMLRRQLMLTAISLAVTSLSAMAQNTDRAAIYERKLNTFAQPSNEPRALRSDAVQSVVGDVRARNVAAERSVVSSSRTEKNPAVAPSPEPEPFGWSFSLDTSAEYDTSAFDDYLEKADWYWETNLGIGLERALNDKWGYSVGGSATWDRYDRYSELDTDILGLSAGVAYAASSKLTVALDHQSLWLYSAGFDDNFLTVHDTALSTAYTLSESVIWKLSATRREADPSRANRWAFASSLSYTKKLDELVQGLSLNFGGLVQYTTYDSPSDRHAWATKAWVKVKKAFSKSFSITLAATYLHNDDSTFNDALGVEPLDYDKWGFRPTLAFTYVW